MRPSGLDPRGKGHLWREVPPGYDVIMVNVTSARPSATRLIRGGMYWPKNAAIRNSTKAMISRIRSTMSAYPIYLTITHQTLTSLSASK